MSTTKNIGIHIDIESLDLGPKSVVTQIAFVAIDLNDPETIYREVEEYLPIQPQLTLDRTVNAETLIWWLQQDEKARERFNQNRGNDMDELTSLVNSVVRKLGQVLDEADSYEIWARGPQFDIVNIETLLADCGEVVPWKHDTVRDLRTLMALAGVGKSEVPMPAGQVAHVALSDCKLQIACYVESIRRLRSA